jgi:hypothetical protein
MTPLRLLIHDRTCVGEGLRLGLSDAWKAGGTLYRGLGRLDGVRGASSWNEALGWLADESQRVGRPIGEVQFWGHGRRGRAMVGDEALDVRSLQADSAHGAHLRALRAALAPAGTLWFRTCETVGGAPGRTFARAFADFLGARVAGHTHVIGFWQSGLHALLPGAAPHWPVEEGMSPAGPLAKALDSSPLLPRTIHALQGVIPTGW